MKILVLVFTLLFGVFLISPLVSSCISDVNCPGGGGEICQHDNNQPVIKVSSCVDTVCKTEIIRVVECCVNADCSKDQVCDNLDYKCKGGSIYPTCGDGNVDAGEECDLGNQNGKPGSSCNSVCQDVRVGGTNNNVLLIAGAIIIGFIILAIVLSKKKKPPLME